MRVELAFAAAALCAGCVTTESVQFQAQVRQQTVIRDGTPGLVSKRQNSIVIVRPESRQLQIGGRPVFVLAIYNRTAVPQNFLISNVQVTQLANGEPVPLKVITYEQLVEEEHTRQAECSFGKVSTIYDSSLA